jgi:Zn-dependent M16 (insulinase) family peptidase
MVNRELIKSEIEKIPEERLQELYQVVKGFSNTDTKKNGETLMSKLRKIKIDAPPDFSKNIDLYLNGEKTID